VVDSSLAAKLDSPGFTPGVRDIEPLFSLLAVATDDVAKQVERALSRVADRAAPRAVESFRESAAPLRARLCSLVGRIFVAGERQELGEWLVQRLDDPDPKSRRRAAAALGKTRDPRYEAPLIARFEKAVDGPERRALATALGSVGGARSLSALSSPESADVELARIVKESRIKIERTELRAERSAILTNVAPPSPTELLLHVRPGLEGILMEELENRWRARKAGRGRVTVTVDRPLGDVFRARTFMDVGFPLRAEPVHGGDVAESVVRALTSKPAFEIFSTFTRGPIRYRLDWGRGRRRGTTFDVAARVRRARPELVNDSTAAVWEAVVNAGEGEMGNVVRLELWPRGLVDERFSYRRATLPASSHPTTAAALARIAGVVASDVVWDPFVGAGTELIERALLGPYAALHGSDTDGGALDAALENLRAAAVTRFQLSEGDAQSWGPPSRPSLVLTNPPFGRRNLRRDAVRPLLGAVLQNVAGRLADGGRLVWVSPIPRATFDMAREAGFTLTRRLAVDLGGVPAEIQELRVGQSTPKRGAGRPSRRKL
jgi:23S rRNA G2445 N2-methylase RlmL